MKCSKCGKELVEGDTVYHILKELVLADGTTETDLGVGDYCSGCMDKALPVS